MIAEESGVNPSCQQQARRQRICANTPPYCHQNAAAAKQRSDLTSGGMRWGRWHWTAHECCRVVRGGANQRLPEKMPLTATTPYTSKPTVLLGSPAHHHITFCLLESSRLFEQPSAITQGSTINAKQSLFSPFTPCHMGTAVQEDNRVGLVQTTMRKQCIPKTTIVSHGPP